MKYAIHSCNDRKSGIYDRVFSILPPRIRVEIERICCTLRFVRLCEIRLHRDASVMLNLDGKNYLCACQCTKEDISAAVNYLCGGSLYAHAETIKNGYIRCENGIRAGICGKAITEGGTIVGISEITSINIRIPHRIPMADKVVLELLREEAFAVGVLIYSSPGVGKTTVLRELCHSLTHEEPPLRFAVIDTREEICPTSFFSGPFDVFSGYPQGIGIEVATRTMAPQLILCDEIGNEQDAGAILKAQNVGVPLIATTHCHDFEELKCKKFLNSLLEAKVFRYCVGIKRAEEEDLFRYDVHKIW